MTSQMDDTPGGYGPCLNFFVTVQQLFSDTKTERAIFTFEPKF